jgi:hypothetical protein
LKVVKTLLENKKVFNNFFYLSKSVEREIENDTIVDFLHHFKDTFQTNKTFYLLKPKMLAYNKV